MVELKERPDILRGSREKKQPIYERCLDLQKEKLRRLEVQRIEKDRREAEAIKLIPFKPALKTAPKIRQF